MLSAHELARLCDRLGLSGEARALIETIRSSPPTRRVRSMAGNVSVRYPSRKMGVTIQAESHRVELAGLYEYEHDQQVLEFYDQPPRIKLVYQAKNGRQGSVWHTPDYFVLRTDGIGWEEWKTDDGLERLSQTMPHRYCRDDVGHWRCPPGERFAAHFGLLYRLRPSSEIDWVLQRNLRFLNDYLIKPPSVDQHTAKTVLALVKERPGVQLAVLLDTLGEAQADNIYTLIASGRIYVDLHAAALAEPQQVQLFPDQETASAYALVCKLESSVAAPWPRYLRNWHKPTPPTCGRRIVATPSSLRIWLESPPRRQQHLHGRFAVGWRSGGSLNRATDAATLACCPNRDNAATARASCLKRRWCSLKNS